MTVILLTCELIDTALPVVSSGLGQYLAVQSRVTAEDFYDDPEFQRAYNGFYRIRRDTRWQAAYYALMGRAKRENLQFAEILTSLHIATGQYEASFTSKLIATLDPSKPVIDSVVLKNVGLRLPNRLSKDRTAQICRIYDELCSVMAAFLTTEPGGYLIREFKRFYPDADITETKMLDLVLWQSGR